MSNSQLQELGIVNKQLELITKEAESLKNQIESNSKLAAKVNEEISVYQKMKKRVRSTSYIELGIGITCLFFGCLPIWTDEQKNIQNLLLGVGTTGTVAGAAGFVFTITF